MLRDQPARRLAFSRVEFFVGLLFGSIMLGCLASCADRLRATAGRSNTTNRLKWMGLAAQNCNDALKQLPPAYDKFHTMTVPASVHLYLAPFLENDNFYQAYRTAKDKDWFERVIVTPFISPEDPTLREGAGIQNFAANLRVFSDRGRETGYDGDMEPVEIEPGTASLPESVPDGVSNTIAFATKFGVCGKGGSRFRAAPDSTFGAFFGQNAARKRADSVDSRGTFQVNPSRTDCQPTPLMAQSFTGEGLLVSFFDGSVRTISPSLSPQTWNRAVQPNDNMKLGEDWN